MKIDDRCPGPLPGDNGLEQTTAEMQRRCIILQHAVENTNEAFVTIDQDSTVILFNKSAERMFGYHRQEVIGFNLSKILSPMCREEHQKAVDRYVATGQARLIGHESEVQITRKNGESFPAAISFSVTRVEGCQYFTGLVRDLSDTKSLQERLIRNERLAALGQAVAEISHEIKNPLIMIGGFSRQLLKKAEKEKDKNKLAIIVSEVERLEHLLAGLRDLYKVKQLNLDPILLNELLLEVVGQVRSFPDAEKLEVRFEPQAEVTVRVDREKMKQVLLNLVKNGIEATPPGGMVAIRTRVGEQVVEIDVIDTGKGIPEEVKERLFSPFVTTKQQGTGLGLSISKRIIEDHPGSSLKIESGEDGSGTVATIGLFHEKKT